MSGHTKARVSAVPLLDEEDAIKADQVRHAYHSLCRVGRYREVNSSIDKLLSSEEDFYNCLREAAYASGNAGADTKGNPFDINRGLALSILLASGAYYHRASMQEGKTGYGYERDEKAIALLRQEIDRIRRPAVYQR